MSSAKFQTCTPSEMDRSAFVEKFGAVYEHAPWVAERAFDRGLSAAHDRIAGLHTLMGDVVLEADPETQLALIRAHPDLAGKAAVAGELTDCSATEQASAGLQSCNAEEYARFQELNAAYREKFGFPFIMAVRDRHRMQILEAFAERLQHGADTEFNQALREINRIALLRLQTM